MYKEVGTKALTHVTDFVRPTFPLGCAVSPPFASRGHPFLSDGYPLPRREAIGMGKASALERGSNLGLERRRNGEQDERLSRKDERLSRKMVGERVFSPEVPTSGSSPSTAREALKNHLQSDAPLWGEEGGVEERGERWAARSA
jgi:hypothetical protein